MATRPVYGVMDFLAGFRLPTSASAAPADGEMYTSGGKVYLRYGGAWVEIGAGGGGGTVISSGNGAPTDVTGNTGDYYLDKTGQTLYGPKAAGGTATSVFTTQTPAPTSSQITNYEWGNRITIAAAGFITHLRYYRLATSQTSHTLRLWDNGTGSLLGSVSASAETGTGWRNLALAAPIAVTAGLNVVVSFTGDGVSDNAFDAGGLATPIVNAPLTATGSAYTSAAGTRPINTGSHNAWLDVVYNTSGDVTGPQWPVALKSVPAGGTTSQALVKTSATDYALSWATPAGGGGSIILSGSGAPADALGDLGEYYLDKTGQALYGPKISLTSQSLYGSQTGSWYTDPTALTIGSEITCAVAGVITALQFNKSDTSFPRTHTMRLWKADGTQLGSAVTPDESGTGWMTATLATPVAVTAGQKVRVSIDFPGGSGLTRYGTSPLTNGGLSLSTTNGWYAIGTNTYPSVSDTNGNMMLDVVWSSGSAWPVALKSVPAGGTTSQALVKTSGTDYATQWSTPAAAGSVILSGNGAPDAVATGNVGEYYLDKTGLALYGPKNAPPLAGSEVSYHTTQQPVGNSDYTATEGGMRFTCAVAGYIMALQYYRTAADGGTNTRTMRLWNSGGTQLAVVTGTIAAGVGWNTLTLTTPVAVAAGASLAVSFTGVGQKGTTNSGLPLTNGSLTTTAVAYYTMTPGTYPNTAMGNQDQFVDVVFSTTGVTPPPIWPVALKSIPAGGTTSQVLSKTSATDYDATWATPAAGGGAAAPVRATVSKTTASLAPGTAEIGTITLAASYRLMQITTSVPARVRLYTTAAKRDADVARAIGAASTGDPGLMLEYVMVDRPAVWGSGQSVFSARGYDSFTTAGSSYAAASDITCQTAGRITAVKFYRVSGSGVTSRSVKVWTTSGALLGSGSTSGESGSGWITVPLSTPAIVSAGQVVRVAYDRIDGEQGAYVTLGSPLTQGDLTVAALGYWAPGSLGGFPSTQHPSINYYVDVVFQSGSPNLLTADLSPVVDGFDGKATPDGLIPYTITNTGAGAAPVTVSFLWLRSE